MKQLNFFPYYVDLLAQGLKTTTLRLSPAAPFTAGDAVTITSGWAEAAADVVRSGRIEAVYERRIQELTPEDLRGESPDCLSAAAAQLVLGCIYRTALLPESTVWVVKFAYD